MIIDAHQHFWVYDPVGYAWINDDMKAIRRDFGPADLESILERNGVDGTVVVQVEEKNEDTLFMLDHAERNDFIKGVVGWTDLTSPRLEDDLRSWKRYGKLKGFRAIMQGAPDDRYLSNKDFQAGVRKLHTFGYTYDVLIYHDQMVSAAKFLEKCPEQPIILDHIAKPAIRDGEIKKWREHMKVLASFPNLRCKLSGIITEARWDRWSYDLLYPYLETAAEFFGTGRLCYGSDWPVCLVAGKYDEVLGIVMRFLDQVNTVEREQVLSGNAISFYNLK